MTPYLRRLALLPAAIEAEPPSDLGLVVVVPAYDEPHLLGSLQALAACRAPGCAVEVLVVINHSEVDAPEVKISNQRAAEQAQAWAESRRTSWLTFHILYCPDLPAKYAGVGTARKVGMDEACRRLEAAGHPQGLILGFDADSQCDTNYFLAVGQYFQQHPQLHAAGIYFEHPLSGADFPAAVYQAVLLYELHLRYFINAQAWAGLPYAFQTVGSAMAVRCRAYQEQGGMNRRKAGEDFYFLHKFTALGRFGQINTTRVIPSPRPSHRVPFGTGRAVSRLLENNLQGTTYAPESFVQLRQFIQQVPRLYQAQYVPQMTASLEAFMAFVGLRHRLAEIRQHTGGAEAFAKRFFRWFDAFMIMKYLHFMRDGYLPNVPVKDAASWLTEVSGYGTTKEAREQDLLLLWRNVDRSR